MDYYNIIEYYLLLQLAFLPSRLSIDISDISDNATQFKNKNIIRYTDRRYEVADYLFRNNPSNLRIK